MKIGFIGDIVGKPGRNIIKQKLKKLRDEHDLDFVIANGENTSHGFGLMPKNAKELFDAGVDLITGGNHSFDKKDVLALFETEPVIRPANYPPEVPGKGIYECEVNGTKFAVINLMGMYAMPQCENPFRFAKGAIEDLKNRGFKHIFIDFHAEATSEKRGIFKMFQEDLSGVCGTHTHVGTDDLVIENGCAYVTDAGLTGCRDNIIGMDTKAPFERFMTGLSKKFDIPDKCKKILQIIIMEFDNDGNAVDAYKLKLFDDRDDEILLKAFVE